MKKFIVVSGSPMSGKSTYVEEHKGHNDVVYDYDSLMSAITNQPMHFNNKLLIDYILDIRNVMIKRFKSDTSIQTMWIITTRYRKELEKILEGYTVEHIEMKVSKEELLQRLHDNPSGRDIQETTQLIHKFIQDEQSHADKVERYKFYKSKEWLAFRELILKRDNKECQRCNGRWIDEKHPIRQVRLTEGYEVHHILSVQDYPQHKLEPWNVVTLCTHCHNVVEGRAEWFKYKKKKQAINEERW